MEASGRKVGDISEIREGGNRLGKIPFEKKDGKPTPLMPVKEVGSRDLVKEYYQKYPQKKAEQETNEQVLFEMVRTLREVIRKGYSWWMTVDRTGIVATISTDPRMSAVASGRAAGEDIPGAVKAAVNDLKDRGCV